MKRLQRTARAGSWFVLAAGAVATCGFLLTTVAAPAPPPGVSAPGNAAAAPAGSNAPVKPITPAASATPAPAAKPGSAINVRDLGAVGDGAADDTAAIQRALDKVGLSGGVVLFPPGKYRVASRHRLRGKDLALLLSAPVPPPLPIKLVGDAATVVHDAGDVVLLHVGDAARPYAIDSFEVTGLRFAGTRTGRRNDDIAKFGNTLLFLDRVANARVHHNHFERSTGCGVYFAATRSTVIDHNQFENSNGGVQGIGSRDVLIDGNAFTCTVKCDDQVAVFGTEKGWSANVKIVNNLVDKGYDGRRGGAKGAARGWARCVAVGLYCENVDVSGNTLVNCNSSSEEDRGHELGLGAVLLEAGPDALRNVQVRGNTIGNCRWAIRATGGVDGLTVSGNSVRDVEEDVFRIAPSGGVYSFAGIEVSGNRFKNCGKAGGNLMIFYMTDGLQVDRNTFSDCAAARVVHLVDAAGKVTGQKSVFIRDNVIERLAEEPEGTVIGYETIHDRLVISGNHVSAKRKTHVHGYKLMPAAQLVIDGNTFEGWTQTPVFTEGWTGVPANGSGNYCRPDGAAWEGRWAAPIRFDSGWGADGRATAFAAEPPKSGPWQAGDVVHNRKPAPGAATGWYCTTSGSPGAWLPLGQVTTPVPQGQR